MTVRNVRAYQSRGLIPPPELRGRTGYYGEEHVQRLELIRDLQAEGFNLEAIKRILDRAPGGSIGEVLDFTRAVAAPFGDEPPQVVDAEAFVERGGVGGGVGRQGGPGRGPPGRAPGLASRPGRGALRAAEPAPPGGCLGAR